jgi:hypothetical protein
MISSSSIMEVTWGKIGKRQVNNGGCECRVALCKPMTPRDQSVLLVEIWIAISDAESKLWSVKHKRSRAIFS